MITNFHSTSTVPPKKLDFSTHNVMMTYTDKSFITL